MDVTGGRLIGDTWAVRKRVGKGTFSELFLGKNVLFRSNGHQVAIKMQNEGTEGVVVRHEGDVLRSLGGIPTAPAYIHHGQYKNREYLVMEILGGEDMSSLRDRVRKATGTHLVPLPAAAYLARQMLTCIKNIHERGFIHRDIKPANFVRREANSPRFCMIDFGVAKQFRDKNGALKPKREFAEFRGTVQYASPFVHDGHDQCPRDDLFSLLLVFMDLVCGKLPWAEAYRQTKDKAAAAAAKREYLSNPERMMEWVANAVVAAERAASGEAPFPDGPAEEGEEMPSAQNFPDLARTATLGIIQYLQSLEYESTPDYGMIEQALLSMHPYGHPDVADPNYNFGGFSWEGGKDNRLPETGIERLSGDPRMIHSVLSVRAQQLGKWLQQRKRRRASSEGGGAAEAHSLGSQSDSQHEGKSHNHRQSQGQGQGHSQSQSSGGPEVHLLELAGYWATLSKDFLALDAEFVSRDLCELMLAVCRDAGRFQDVPLNQENGQEQGMDQELEQGSMAYSEWISLQQHTHRVMELCLGVLRKPRPIEAFGFGKSRGGFET